MSQVSQVIFEWASSRLFLYLFVDNVVTFQVSDEEAGLYKKHSNTKEVNCLEWTRCSKGVVFFATYIVSEISQGLPLELEQI